jgi:hypothetical protein
MRSRLLLRVFVIAVVGVAFLFSAQGWGQSHLKDKAKKYKPCGIRLNSLSHTSGAPGDVIKLYGTWGPTQGTKIPCINKGGMNRLIVLHWSNSAIKVKIPGGLAPGLYKVGVYCNELSVGGSYSSGWKDFKLIKKSKVDIDVADIYLDKKCRLWVKHFNRGTEPINKVLRERVWVNGRQIDDSTETIVIAPGRWYSHGILADPGYIVRSSATVKIQIDVDNVLRETNERNNILTKRVTCKMKFLPKKGLKLKSKSLHK